MRITIIHGFNATPNDHFYPWLAEKLRALGHEVRVPELPLKTGATPELVPLIESMRESIGVLNESDIVIGHSLGGVLAMRYLEAVELKGSPRAFILVAAPWRTKNPDTQSFFMTDLDYDVVPWKASEFFVIHSRDDATVPIDHGEKWAAILKAKLLDDPGNDHYMGTEYPLILQTIQSIVDHPLEFAPGQTLPDAYKS